MPTTVHDASLVTRKNRNIALNSYYSTWNTNTVLGGLTPNPALKAPGVTSAETLLQAKNGCLQCQVLSNADPLNTNRDPNLLEIQNRSAGGPKSATGTS